MRMTSAATLVERAGHLYRQLLLLQRVFPDASEDTRPLPFGDDDDSRSLCYGIREVLDRLAEEARVLTTVPLPIGHWRPGDGADDERWRALTEVERRELSSLIAGYESLIALVERETAPGLELAERPDGSGDVRRRSFRNGVEAREILQVERARLSRFRQEMGFLDRRRPQRETA
jgi:hypothetical protein